eukprot:8713-Hanusia_phi.AAC.1
MMSPGGTAVTADRTETSGPATQLKFSGPQLRPPLLRSRGLWSDRPGLTRTQTQSSRYIPFHRVTSKGKRGASQQRARRRARDQAEEEEEKLACCPMH